MVNSKLSHEFGAEDCGANAWSWRGDQLAAVRIVLPEGGDAEFEALMKKWRGDKPLDRRKDM
jgi:hypothetical protein